jgi:alpha-galactosidase
MEIAMNPGKPLATTPPMGWNSWNMFGDKVTETAVRETAEAMAANGLKECGYEYLVIDDCWSRKEGRNSHGDLVPHPNKFPNGMKALADYIHGLGFKLGIYSDAADFTCASYPGSYGFEEQDAYLWASWGIDFLKYDYCSAPADQETAIRRYARMGDALKRTGREILFSLCEWGGRSPYLWGRSVGGQMWRVTGDVVDSWANTFVPEHNWTGLGIDAAIDIGVNLHEYAGPGGWNDMDMLIVGLQGKGQIPGMGSTMAEYQTHMSMWSMLCSPLMIGCDVRHMDQEVASLLMNREVLAVNQDVLGKQAMRIKKNGALEVWKKKLADGSVAVAMLNRGSVSGEIAFTAGDVGLLDSSKLVRDLWKEEDISEFSKSFSREVLPHATLLVKVTTE